MQWNWDHIRFFLALAEQGTLSSSAKTLGVSHSTVLRRIRQLEIDLNTPLFDQTNSGYSLTAAGRKLHAEAIKMRSTISALSREISDANDQLQGEVVITTTDTIAYHLLPKLLNQLSKQYNELSFSVFMATQLEDMGNRNADIAIRTGKQPPGNLIGRRVGTIKFVAVASKQYAKQKQLKKFPSNPEGLRFITLDDSFAAAPFYQWFKPRIEASKSVTTANNFLSAAALAKEHMGITLLPSYMLEADNSLVKLDTGSDFSSTDIWVLSHPDSRNSEKVKVVRQHLYEELPKLLTSMPI